MPMKARGVHQVLSMNRLEILDVGQVTKSGLLGKIIVPKTPPKGLALGAVHLVTALEPSHRILGLGPRGREVSSVVGIGHS